MSGAAQLTVAWFGLAMAATLSGGAGGVVVDSAKKVTPPQTGASGERTSSKSALSPAVPMAARELVSLFCSDMPSPSTKALDGSLVVVKVRMTRTWSTATGLRFDTVPQTWLASFASEHAFCVMLKLCSGGVWETAAVTDATAEWSYHAGSGKASL